MTNYEPIEALRDSPRIFVSVDFFRKPPPGVVIEWTDGVTSGGYCSAVRNHKPCHEACMAGVVVKLIKPRRVWVLTGNAHTERTGADGAIIHLLGYEAVWPD